MGAIGDILGAAANPFGSPSKGEWNLIEASFITNETNIKTVLYVVTKDKPGQKTGLESISDSGGRRTVVYEYPYFDGQRVEDLGRKGAKFAFSLKFYGNNYQVKLNEFLTNVVNRKESGILSHPVLGSIPGKFTEYEAVHKYDEWNAVTIRATFVEDNNGSLASANLAAASPNSALRNALQAVTDAQSTIGNAIFVVGAALLLPSAIKNSLKQRFDSITGQISRLLGQLGATFSTDAQLHNLATQANSVTNGIGGLNSGSVNAGGSNQASIPPLYQVGFDQSAQDTINANIQAFLSANQITTQQAVFSANQARQAIADAIAEIEELLGLSGYDILLQYRGLAVQIQEATESCISSANSNIILYTVPTPMSLRTIAFKNGLSPDRQNEIDALNPYLDSINYVLPGTVLVLPAS